MKSPRDTKFRLFAWAIVGLMMVSASVPDARASSFDIVIQPDAALAANADALAAMERAAQAWEAQFTDPITVTIDARFESLGANVLGSASPVTFDAGYLGLRSLMIADADADDDLMASLPAAEPAVTLPDDYTLGPQWSMAKANGKALGLPLDLGLGPIDGVLRMSSTIAYDFDNSDGVLADHYDFETIAIHEIGHMLGYLSGVQEVDARLNANQPGEVKPFVWDLFRFQNDVPGADPSTPAEFSSFSRSLLTGGDSITDIIEDEYRMSTGIETGDGRQPSHWKANEQSGVLIGVMDPTFAREEVVPLSFPDLRTLDLMGYDWVAVPEPSTATLALAAVVALTWRRGSRRERSRPRSA